MSPVSCVRCSAGGYSTRIRHRKTSSTAKVGMGGLVVQICHFVYKSPVWQKYAYTGTCYKWTPLRRGKSVRGTGWVRMWPDTGDIITTRDTLTEYMP